MPFERTSSGIRTFGGVDCVSMAQEYGTPAYVYDLDGMARSARELAVAFGGAPHLVAYAVKANTAGGVVRTLTREGCGADVVSEAELLVATACGVDPARIVFSGVAKQDHEIDRAVALGIQALQMESVEEIGRVEARARAVGRKARVSLRLNPSVDLSGATHAHIATGHDAAKFGIRSEDVLGAARKAEASPHLELVGMATHVGSQFTSVGPYLDGARVLCDTVRALRDEGCLASLAFIDTGGGFGVDYGRVGGHASTGPPPSPGDFVRAVRVEMKARRLDDLLHVVEPGRSLVAPHGVLLSRVIQPKITSSGRWLMIDAGMNDLMRPALYQAHHAIVPVDGDGASGEAWVPWRVAGPVCESSDDFGEHFLPRVLPSAVAILDAGAYGYTMANRYNGRQLPPEVFLSGGRVVARTRRSAQDAWVDERVGAG